MFITDNNDNIIWLLKAFQAVRMPGFHYLTCLPET